jgi:DNA-directed RNA polymerase specialized sigma24 family protein
VRKALTGLSPEDRTLVELVYFEDMPIKEAAAVLEKSVTATKVKAMRARQKMRSLIETYLT